MSSLTIRFSKNSRKIIITSEGAPVECALIESEQRDRRIVRVLRKYLDMEFTAGELEILKRSDFEALGELLFELVFYDNNAKNQFKEFYTKSWLNKEKYGHINIYLEFEKYRDFEDLAILPWEYIYYKPKETKNGEKELIGDYPFLAADYELKFNFYRKLPYKEFAFKDLAAKDPNRFQLIPPVKILLIIAHPTKKPINVKEVLNSFKLLAEKHGDLMEIRLLTQPTEKLSEELEFGKEIDTKFKDFNFKAQDKDFKPDIIHFIGHGKVVDENGVLLLINNDIPEFDKIYEMKDEDFAKAIAHAHLEPKLVFLQVCNGGRIIDYIKEQGIAVRLLLKKIPFVIAMQNPIEEDQALKFAEIFYENFMNGEDIGLAVTEGRCHLGYANEYSRKSFGSPVLYTYVDHPLQVVAKQDVDDGNVLGRYKVCPNETCDKHQTNFHFSSDNVFCSICASVLELKGKLQTSATAVRSRETTVEASGKPQKSADSRMH